MQQILANLLLSSPPIKALVGNNIDWDTSVQGATGPRIIMFVISAPVSYKMSGPAQHFMTRVQFDCRANTAAQRRQLADALDAFLSGYKGTFSGFKLDGAFKDGHQTRFDQDGATKWFQAQLDYRLYWAPA